MQLWLISASVNEPFVVGGLKLHTSCPLAIVGVPWVWLSVAFVMARSVIIWVQFRLGQSGAPAIVRFIGGGVVSPTPMISPGGTGRGNPPVTPAEATAIGAGSRHLMIFAVTGALAGRQARRGCDGRGVKIDVDG